MSDRHRRLGLPHSPTLHEVRRAYRELARRCRARRGEPGFRDRLDSWHVAYAVNTPDRDGTGAEAVPGSHAAGCEDAFLDEVDVDFPSMSKLVGRMRRSFFGATAPCALSADVRLTPSQADSGVSVPFDVSLRHTCPGLRGTRRGLARPLRCVRRQRGGAAAAPGSARGAAGGAGRHLCAFRRDPALCPGRPHPAANIRSVTVHGAVRPTRTADSGCGSPGSPRALGSPWQEVPLHSAGEASCLNRAPRRPRCDAGFCRWLSVRTCRCTR